MITGAMLEAERFNQMLWNALLFTTKTGVAEGKVLFSVARWELTVYACDDFISVRDKISIDAPETTDAIVIDNDQFTVDVADLKKLEAETRKATGPITISVVDDPDGSSLRVSAEGMVDYCIDVSPPSDVWAVIQELADHEPEWVPETRDFYINPDRMKQIPRMKIPVDHPVALRYMVAEDQAMLAFKLGPTVQGVISSMDDAVLALRGVTMW